MPFFLKCLVLLKGRSPYLRGARTFRHRLANRRTIYFTWLALGTCCMTRAQDYLHGPKHHYFSVFLPVLLPPFPHSPIPPFPHSFILELFLASHSSCFHIHLPSHFFSPLFTLAIHSSDVSQLIPLACSCCPLAQPGQGRPRDRRQQ